MDEQLNTANDQAGASVNAGALTVSEANEVSVAGVQEPRPARNFQDLLRYSTEVTSARGESSQSLGPMDEESKRFLNEALASMTTNVVAELKSGTEIIENLLKSDYFPEEDCDAAFDNILELVDKIDFANDFHKIGGFRIFTPCLTASSDLMRWRCCELIAELCQNNPYCQNKCLQEGYMSTLLALIESDDSAMVRIKALYAVSCLVRENDGVLKEFIAKDGFSVLLRALQSESEKLKIKASFLLSSLCSQCPEVKGYLVSMGFVEQIIGLMIQNRTEWNIMEHFLNVLVALNDNAAAQEICRRRELQLKSLLESILEFENSPDTRDEAKEVIDLARTIIQNVFGEPYLSVQEDR